MILSPNILPQLFTTGYGDISAHSVYEQWMSSVTILIGSCFFAYLISVLSEGLRDDPQLKEILKRRKQALAFCSHYDFPPELRKAVCTHVKFFSKHNYNFDRDQIMELLPNHIQKEVWHHLAVNQLQGMDIFKKLERDIVGQIALRMTRKSVGEEQKLFQRGDIGRELYIQRTGKSKIIYGETSITRKLGRGDVVGEESLFSRKREDTVICLVWCEFFVLDIEDIFNVLVLNYGPKLAKRKWDKMRDTIRRTESKTNLLANMAHRRVALKNQTSSLSTQSTQSTPGFERQLSEEAKQEREQEKSKKTKPHFRSLKNLFMEHQDSATRHRKVMKHHDKYRQKSYGYSYLGQESTLEVMDEEDEDFERIDIHDFEYVDDYLDRDETERLTRNKSNVSNASNLSNLSRMSVSSSGSCDSLQTEDDFKDIDAITAKDVLEGDIDQKDAEALDSGQIPGMAKDNLKVRKSVYVKQDESVHGGGGGRSELSIEMLENLDNTKTQTSARISPDSPVGARNRDKNVQNGDNGVSDMTRITKTHSD